MPNQLPIPILHDPKNAIGLYRVTDLVDEVQIFGAFRALHDSTYSDEAALREGLAMLLESRYHHTAGDTRTHLTIRRTTVTDAEIARVYGSTPMKPRRPIPIMYCVSTGRGLYYVRDVPMNVKYQGFVFDEAGLSAYTDKDIRNILADPRPHESTQCLAGLGYGDMRRVIVHDDQWESPSVPFGLTQKQLENVCDDYARQQRLHDSKVATPRPSESRSTTWAIRLQQLQDAARESERLRVVCQSQYDLED
jgi:hypothetical protein